MSSFVTQCPHCRTRFRVSHAQLSVAKGTVRCGACLAVFNASDALRRDETSTEQNTPVVPPSPPAVPRVSQPSQNPVVVDSKPQASQTDQILWIHDEFNLDNLDLDEELAKLEQQELQPSPGFSEPEPGPTEYTLPLEPPRPDPHDERWAAQLLLDENELTLTAEAVKPTDAVPIRLNPAVADPPSGPQAISRQPQRRVKTQSAPDERLEPIIGAIAKQADLPTEQTESDELMVVPDQRREPDLDDGPPLFDLDDEPLQLDWQQHRKPWGRWLGWGTLNLIALLALLGQYVVYNFDELARQDRYRPWLEQLCPTLGCTLPPRVDVSQIKSSNLVVRSHPQFAGALVVDAIIYNRAPFEQPFPLLEIRFADLSGQALASRRFKPGEYLSGELAGQTQMPSQIPIHIALDILDPGEQAVNYSLEFHSPK